MSATRIAAVQMVSGPDIAQNLRDADRLVAEAAARGARLVALPEYFCLLGRNDRDKLAIAEADGDGPIQAHLAEAARRLGLWVIGGTLPIKTDDPERVRNTCLVWGPDGERVARYDKIHLFAFDNGGDVRSTTACDAAQRSQHMLGGGDQRTVAVAQNGCKFGGDDGFGGCLNFAVAAI